MPLSAAADDLAGVGAAVALKIGRFDPFLERAAQLERERRAAAPDDKAAEACWMQGRREEGGTGPDVWTYDVWALEAERVGEADHELAHRPGRHHLIPSLGVTEPRQVDRDQVGVGREPSPHRFERQQALRPWAEQKGVMVSLIAFGEADG